MPLCSVSPARRGFFFATLSTQLNAWLAAAAFPNTTNHVSKETGISCSPSLVDAHITFAHHPDKNICDLKKAIAKPIWRWISSLRDIFVQARCLKTVVLHDTYWQARHTTVQCVGSWVVLFIFIGDLHLKKVYDWKGRIWYFECEFTYFMNMWQWVTDIHTYVCVYKCTLPYILCTSFACWVYRLVLKLPCSTALLIHFIGGWGRMLVQMLYSAQENNLQVMF